MKTFIIATLAGVTLGFSQEIAPVDMEARRASVKTLEDRISQRQKRLEEVASDIREEGKKIDSRIEAIVRKLASLKDSQDSKRRITEVKIQAIGGLKRMIAAYQTERGKVYETLRSGDAASADALKKDMQAIDTLVDKRAADILELVKSVPGGEDISKYEYDGDYTRNGVTYENSRINEAWKQNRRDKVQSEKLRREAQDALKKAIGTLESRQASLKTSAEEGGISSAEKEIRKEELGHVSSLLDQRKSQLAELSLPSAAPGETASMDEAEDISGALADARADIAADFAKTLRLYRAAVGEREKIAELNENLEARKKWLAEHDK